MLYQEAAAGRAPDLPELLFGGEPLAVVAGFYKRVYKDIIRMNVNVPYTYPIPQLSID